MLNVVMPSILFIVILNDTQYRMPYAECRNAKHFIYCYTECHYAGCRAAKLVRLFWQPYTDFWLQLSSFSKIWQILSQ
jgi:hypothetical protein